MSVISFRQLFRIGQRVWAKSAKLNKNNTLPTNWNGNRRR